MYIFIVDGGKQHRGIWRSVKVMEKDVINIKIVGYSREIISDLDVKCRKECKEVSFEQFAVVSKCSVLHGGLTCASITAFVGWQKFTKRDDDM